jgi:hypothetical protein
MTVSAQLQVIDKVSPELSKNYICCGNTRHSVYLPFLVNYKNSFKPLVNGQFYKFSNDLYERFTCSNHFKTIYRIFEKQIFLRSDYNIMCKDAYNLLNK